MVEVVLLFGQTLHGLEVHSAAVSGPAIASATDSSLAVNVIEIN